MIEKLLLAVSITFSLSLFLQVRGPDQHHDDTSYQQATKVTTENLVTLKKNQQAAGVRLQNSTEFWALDR
ncbi:MAG: hypothetical protein PUP92_37810 [Rhizonema sp. PD38]|nr:hypothetical protein [Rhizonema sp. PD38]